MIYANESLALSSQEQAADERGYLQKKIWAEIRALTAVNEPRQPVGREKKAVVAEKSRSVAHLLVAWFHGGT